MRVSLWIMIALCVVLHIQDAAAATTKSCGCKKHSKQYDWARVGIVQLFGWRFVDIARECETYLSPNFFWAVQVLPITDHPMITPLRPWWEVYQPVSYQIISKAGTETEFRDMVLRCNNAGVRVFVDVVINHMSNHSNDQYKSVGNAKWDVTKRCYYDQSVNYQACHFHNSCPLKNYQNAWEVRNCELYGLPDLKTEDNYVRQKQIDFLNKIIDWGVSGIRFDTAKHVAVADLQYIKSKLHCLNKRWFSADVKIFIYQEVVDLGTESIKETEYVSVGSVEEFKFTDRISKAILGKTCITTLEDIKCTNTMVQKWGLVASDQAVIFVDNHDTQRKSILTDVITYQDREKYILAYHFMFAANYGQIRIMSSYSFTLDKKDNGPPCDGRGNILSPYDNNGNCGNGYQCEHRYPEIRALVHSKFIANLKKIKWEVTDWASESNHIAFTIGYYAMFIYNRTTTDITIRVKTSIDCGVYCDVLSGGLVGGRCKGYEIRVEDSYASVTIKSTTKMVYLHISNRMATV